jgi:hypothetical protein
MLAIASMYGSRRHTRPIKPGGESVVSKVDGDSDWKNIGDPDDYGSLKKTPEAPSIGPASLSIGIVTQLILLVLILYDNFRTTVYCYVYIACGFLVSLSVIIVGKCYWDDIVLGICLGTVVLLVFIGLLICAGMLTPLVI